MILEQERAYSKILFSEYAKIAVEKCFREMAVAFESLAKIDEAQEKKFADILNKLKNDSIFNKEGEVGWRCQ